MLTRSRRTRGLLIAGGYGAALWAAWALVELRHWLGGALLANRGR